MSHHDDIHRRSDPTPPFMREAIPTEESNPDLHHKLTQLWYQRQNAVRGLGDALASDDLREYAKHVRTIN